MFLIVCYTWCVYVYHGTVLTRTDLATGAPEEVGGSVPVLPEEIEATLYQPSEEEWPNGGREESTQRILRGLEQVMGLSIAEIFLTPVDITLYPLYAYTIEYPIDLSLIKVPTNL